MSGELELNFVKMAMEKILENANYHRMTLLAQVELLKLLLKGRDY